MLLVWVQSVELVGFFLHLFSSRNDFFSDRVAGHYDSVCREESFHAFICHADAFCLLAENLVGESGKSVLLLNQSRHSKLACCPEKGSAGITTNTDGDVGLELSDYLLCHSHTLDHLEWECEI